MNMAHQVEVNSGQEPKDSPQPHSSKKILKRSR